VDRACTCGTGLRWGLAVVWACEACACRARWLSTVDTAASLVTYQPTKPSSLDSFDRILWWTE
jgi:hypothetical protein